MNVNELREVLKYESTYDDVQELIKDIEDDFKRGVRVLYKNISVTVEIPGYLPNIWKDALFRYFLDHGILISISKKKENTDIVLYDLAEHITYGMGQKIISERVYFNNKKEEK